MHDMYCNRGNEACGIHLEPNDMMEYPQSMILPFRNVYRISILNSHIAEN